MQPDNASRHIRASSEERIRRLKSMLHSLATRIPVIKLKRAEELYPSLQHSMIVLLHNSTINDSKLCDTRQKTYNLLDLTCDKCQMTFMDEDSLETHICKTFLCDICKKSFPYSSSLKHHSCTCEHDTVYECGICNKEFRSLVYLDQHRKMAHDENKQCEICGKIFSKRSHLMNHQRSHNVVMGHSVNNLQLDGCEDLCISTEKNTQVNQVFGEISNEKTIQIRQDAKICRKDMKQGERIKVNYDQEQQVLENRFGHKGSFEKQFSEFVEKVLDQEDQGIEEYSEQEVQIVEESKQENKEIVIKNSELQQLIVEKCFENAVVENKSDDEVVIVEMNPSSGKN